MKKKQKKIILIISVTLTILFVVIIINRFIKVEFVGKSPLTDKSFSDKIQTTSWKNYSSKKLNLSFKYPENWRVYEFSQDNGYSYIINLDSPDVESVNTYKGGGIEISIYFDKVKERTGTDLSPEEYIKNRKYTMPPFNETIYKNGYKAIKFCPPDLKDNEGLVYFDIPFRDEILNVKIRFTDKKRRQEAEDIADSIVSSFVIDIK